MKNDYYNSINEKLLKKPIEIVYFAFPKCNGNCAHCWSSNMELGNIVPISKHKENLDALSLLKVSELKISGGEPFFNPNIGEIIEYARDRFKDSKITIFTSGRTFVSKKDGEEGIIETYNNLCNKIKNFNNISLQMSADEYHADVLKRLNPKSEKSKEELLNIHVKNFVFACKRIKKKYPKFEYYLKTHVNFNRLEYHKKLFQSWMSEKFWDEKVIKSEGLIKSGNASKLKDSIEIEESNQWSLFVLPGVDFVEKAEEYLEKFQDFSDDRNLYLVKKPPESIVIAGWWNLINRKAYYFRISSIQKNTN